MGSNIHNIRNGLNMTSNYKSEQQTISLCLNVHQHITIILLASLLQSIFNIKLHSSASGLPVFHTTMIYQANIHALYTPSAPHSGGETSCGSCWSEGKQNNNHVVQFHTNSLN